MVSGLRYRGLFLQICFKVARNERLRGFGSLLYACVDGLVEVGFLFFWRRWQFLCHAVQLSVQECKQGRWKQTSKTQTRNTEALNPKP